MRTIGSIRRSRTLRLVVTGFALTAMLVGSATVAGADPAPGAAPAPAAPAPSPAPAPGPPAPAAPPPPAPAYLSLTLTTIPANSGGRTDLGPTLTVQANGTAVESPDAASPTRKPGTPAQQIKGHIPVDVLNAAIAEAKSTGTDMGDPKDADGSVTLLDILGATPAQDIHLVIYDPNSTKGLTDQEKANRKQFTDLGQKLLNAFVKN